MYHKRNEEGTASRIQDRNDEGLLHARIHHLFLPPKLLSITLFFLGRKMNKSSHHPCNHAGGLVVVVLVTKKVGTLQNNIPLCIRFD